MDTPESAPVSHSGLLEYASTLIKIAIGITIVAGLAPTIVRC